MRTKCPNADCGQVYKISAAILGSSARCKKCSTVFCVEEYVQPHQIIDLEPENKDPVDGGDKRRRRSPNEIMEEHIDRIKDETVGFLPRLNISLENKENESDTRLLITKMLQKILGYKLEDIKTEQKIQGRRADYVISIGGNDVLVIEAKRIGMALRERQAFQATSYGAHGGIKWAILTNALVWQLYRISTGDKIETDLVFTIDLRDGLDDEEAYWFYLISKHGMSRKNILDNLWRKISALCYDNIVNVILTEDVVVKIRTNLTKQFSCKLTNEEVRSAVEENVFQLG